MLGEVIALSWVPESWQEAKQLPFPLPSGPLAFFCSVDADWHFYADLLSSAGQQLTGPGQSLHYFLAQLPTLSWLHLHVPLRIPGEVPLLPARAGHWSVSEGSYILAPSAVGQIRHMLLRLPRQPS